MSSSTSYRNTSYTTNKSSGGSSWLKIIVVLLLVAAGGYFIWEQTRPNYEELIIGSWYNDENRVSATFERGGGFISNLGLRLGQYSWLDRTRILIREATLFGQDDTEFTVRFDGEDVLYLDDSRFERR